MEETVRGGRGLISPKDLLFFKSYTPFPKEPQPNGGDRRRRGLKDVLFFKILYTFPPRKNSNSWMPVTTSGVER